MMKLIFIIWVILLIPGIKIYRHQDLVDGVFTEKEFNEKDVLVYNIVFFILVITGICGIMYYTKYIKSIFNDSREEVSEEKSDSEEEIKEN